MREVGALLETAGLPETTNGRKLLRDLLRMVASIALSPAGHIGLIVLYSTAKGFASSEPAVRGVRVVWIARPNDPYYFQISSTVLGVLGSALNPEGTELAIDNGQTISVFDVAAQKESRSAATGQNLFSPLATPPLVYSTDGAWIAASRNGFERSQAARPERALG